MHKHVIARLVALILVLVCLTLGIIGLLLPVIPGLLFLALAAALIARHSSWAGERLRRHRGIGRCLDHADGFLDSDFPAKLKLSLLYAAKAVVDTLAFTSRLIGGLVARRRSARSRLMT